ncbi:MAG: NADH-quinone oxidoreductase subunit C [Cytophagales bacterium]|nr:MAG: NADH-quinone oxidoreductase subunit C [Cytophagales bacterium]
MEEVELNKEFITSQLTSSFGHYIINSEETYGMITITVDRSKILEIMNYLYLDPKLSFTFLTDLTGVHFPEPKDELGVVYHLHNLPANIRLRIKTFFPKSDSVIDSLTSLFSSANFMERETYDFFGIIFKGHPNLKRILNVDDLDYFPLRKEYALEDSTRTDKDDTMFGRG